LPVKILSSLMAAELAEENATPLTSQWLRRRGIPAWLLSLLLHLTVFTALGLIVKDVPRGHPAGDEFARGGEIVLARAGAASTVYFSDGEEAAASGTTSPKASAASGGRAMEPFPDAPELPGGGPQLPKGSDVGSALPGGEGPGGTDPLGSGLRPGGGGARASGIGGKAQTQVFGVRGEGTRFVYVFDRSSSMAGFEGRPLAAAKRELIASLEHLDKIHQFQIVFYNQQPQVMRFGGVQTGMVFASDEGKKMAESFVSGIVASGGTQHLPALELALGMRPDVIFFLTDADEPKLLPDELAKIRRLNHGTSINAIEFGAGAPAAAANFLKQLARENGGNYGYVDVTRLPR
jgi:hypothetical protein